MDEIRRWAVTIDIDEHDGHTRAIARLRTRDTDRLVGVGLARLDPSDRDVPEIGEEIATARALSDLARRLRQRSDGQGKQQGADGQHRRPPGSVEVFYTDQTRIDPSLAPVTAIRPRAVSRLIRRPWTKRAVSSPVAAVQRGCSARSPSTQRATCG